MAAEAGAAIKITKEIIETMNNALDLYNKVLDQTVPWKTYRETQKELGRFSGDYPNETAVLVCEIKTLIKNAEDNYFIASQTIYEWCGLTEKLLVIYLDLFKKKESTTYAAQRAVLNNVLDVGIKKMTDGQAQLEQCSTNFNSVAKKLTALHSRLINDFDTKSSYFEGKVSELHTIAYAGAAACLILGPFGLIIPYSAVAGVAEGEIILALTKKFNEVKGFFDRLRKTIDETNVQIDSTKDKLHDEIKVFDVLKVQTEETKTAISLNDLDTLRDTVLEPVNKLIAECKAYQKRHGKKN